MIADDVKNIHQNIKLGTSGGGFLYCGMGENANFDALDREYIIRRAMRIANCRMSIIQIETTLQSSEKAKKAYDIYVSHKIANDVEPLEYEAWLADKKSERQKKEISLSKEVKNILRYKRMADRQVLKKYASISEDNTIIIIIEGNEKGDVWTTDEYEAEKVRKERVNESIESR